MMQKLFSARDDRKLAMPDIDWRTRAYVVGGVVGTLVGVGAAYLYVNAQEEGEEAPKMKPAEAMAIGLAVLALLRQIGGLTGNEPKPKKRR